MNCIYLFIISSEFGSRPSVEVYKPDIQLAAFIQDEDFILSFDTSGEPLERRGYRSSAGLGAPLKENLAALLLNLTEFHTIETSTPDFESVINSPIVMLDPCCGSGTLLIEAAMMYTR